MCVWLRLLHRVSRRPKPKSSPTDLAGQTEIFQGGWIVTSDASGENVGFPGGGWQFQTLELADNLYKPGASMQLRTRMDMLPAQQEADEVGCRHGFDLTPQAANRQPVDAGQQATVAPLVRGA
jgi:hypothetical protein